MDPETPEPTPPPNGNEGQHAITQSPSSDSTYPGMSTGDKEGKGQGKEAAAKNPNNKTPKKPKRSKYVCNRCRGKSQFLLRKLEGYCKECFLFHFARKIRSDIGKHRLIKQHEKLLLGYSGGNRSTALLSFVRNSMDDVKRPFRVQPTTCFIDESIVMHGRYAPQKAEMQKLSESLEFPFVCYCLEDVFAASLKEAPSLRPQTSGQLARLMETISSQTAKDEMLRILRLQLLERIAAELNITKIMTAETATSLAMRCLNLISQGRGGEINAVTSFHRDVADGTQLLLPFRFASSREIALYNFLANNPVYPRIVSSFAGIPTASYERLTERFISGLEHNFPATASAVVRTAQKTQAQSHDAGEESSLGGGFSTECVLCKALIEKRDHDTIAKHHINLAVLTDRIAHNSSSACCHGADDATDSDPCQLPRDQDPHAANCCRTHTLNIIPLLCYGCRNLFIKSSSRCAQVLLPPQVDERIARGANRAQMRAAIQDYLLEDDDDDAECSTSKK